MNFVAKINGQKVRFNIRTFMLNEVRDINQEELRSVFFNVHQLYKCGEIDSYLVMRHLIIKPESGRPFSMDLVEERRERKFDTEDNDKDYVKITTTLTNSPLNLWIGDNEIDVVKQFMRRVVEIFAQIPSEVVRDVSDESKKSVKPKVKITKPEMVH